MALERNVARYVEVLVSPVAEDQPPDPQAVVLASQILSSVEEGLLPGVSALRFVEAATAEWMRQVAKGLPADSPVVALESARKAAGHVHGFPGRDPINRTELASTRYLAQTFEAVRRFHFNMEDWISDSPIDIDSCTPAELNAAVADMLAEIKRRLAVGEPVIRSGAQLGAPLGVVWSTHTVIDPLDKPGIPAANHLRERLGLVDYHWTAGRGLFQYAIDSDQLGECYRPTPVEGFNRRFRLLSFKPHYYEPFGATVDLKQLKNTLEDGGRGDDDGVDEAVCRPIQPSPVLWTDLVRDLRFAGALSKLEYQPHVTESQFQGRVLSGRDPTRRIAAFVEMLVRANEPPGA